MFYFALGHWAEHSQARAPPNDLVRNKTWYNAVFAYYKINCVIVKGQHVYFHDNMVINESDVKQTKAIFVAIIHSRKIGNNHNTKKTHHMKSGIFLTCKKHFNRI